MFRIDHGYLDSLLEIRGDRYHDSADAAVRALKNLVSFDDGGIVDDGPEITIYRDRPAALRGDDPIAVIVYLQRDADDEFCDRYGDDDRDR